MISLWAFALCASTWVMALHFGSQAAIASAVVLTIVMVGVLAIYLILFRSSDRNTT